MSLNQTSFLKRLERSDSLLDVLIQIEDTLDSLDIYAFKSWFKGEVVDGPHVTRYWVEITLKYDYKDMPDPQGGMRLVMHGSKVYYEKTTEEEFIEVETRDDLDEDGNPKTEEKDIWLVKLRIPRRFIDELDDSEISAMDDELADQDVDGETISDAQDEGIEDDADVMGGFDENEGGEGEGEEGEEEDLEL